MTNRPHHGRKMRPSGLSPAPEATVGDRPALEWTGPQLMEALAEVVARGVGDRFSTMPLVVPTPEFFPEPFTATLGWYKRVTSRFMGLCGLGGYEMIVELFDAGVRRELGDMHSLDGGVARIEGHHEGSRTAAWFAGLHTGGLRPRCHFGLDLRLLKDPESLVASMAHEVAHAFRAHHGLTSTAAEVGRRVGVTDLERYEEELTDLTTHALGFGVLNTNAAYLYRQTGGSDGAQQWVAWSHGQSGYLSHVDMSLLLSATLAHREQAGRRDEPKAVLRWLEKTQAAQVKANLALPLDLEPFDARLAALGPSRHSGLIPSRFEPAPFKRHKLDDVDLNAAFDDEDREQLSRRYKGLPIFGVPRHIPAPFRPFSSGPKLMRVLRPTVALSTIALFIALGSPPLGVVFGSALLGLGTDFALRRLFARPGHICSEPDCQELLPEGEVTCPGCGGTIAGIIASADERLAAREALEDRGRRAL